MSKDNKKMIPIFLDLEDPNNVSSVSLEGLPEAAKKAQQALSTDEKVAEVFIGRFIAEKQGVENSR